LFENTFLSLVQVAFSRTARIRFLSKPVFRSRC